MKVKTLKKENSSNKIVHKQSPFKQNMHLPIICAIVAFVLYASTISYGYLLDDAGVITQNEYVQKGVNGIGQIFSSELWHFQNVKLGYYRPLPLATFAIEQEIFHGNAHVSHFINVLLYALTAALLCIFLISIFPGFHPVFSFLITLLFVANPLHTEVVANIKSRDEILSFFFLLLAGFALVKAQSKNNLRYSFFISSMAAFYFALLSKESSVAGVLIFPVLLFFTQTISVKKIFLLSLPFLFLILIFQLQKYLLLGTLAGINGSDLVNYPYALSGSKTASMFLIFAWSIKLLLVPYPLLYSYAYNQIPAVDFSSVGAIIGITIMAIIGFFTWRLISKKSPVAFALLWLLISLIPALAFVLLRGGIFAERFLYSTVLGVSILTVWFLSKMALFDFRLATVDIKTLLTNRKLSVVFALLFFIYSAETFSRNTCWKDEISLVSHDVTIAENNCQAHLHYGTIIVNEGISATGTIKRKELAEKGIQELRTALIINPHLENAYYQIAQAYQKLIGNYDSAIMFYNSAIMENPNYPYSYLGLATLYHQEGKQPLASYYYNKAVEINPYFTEAIALRKIHQQQFGLDIKKFPSQSSSDSSVFDTESNDYNYYNEKGKAFGERGDFPNAYRYLKKAVDMNPNSETALINLAVCLMMTKNYEPSLQILNRVIELNPNNTTALSNLISLYDFLGNKQKADEYRQRIQHLQTAN